MDVWNGSRWLQSKLELNVEPDFEYFVSRFSETLLAVGVMVARLGFYPDAPDSNFPWLASGRAHFRSPFISPLLDPVDVRSASASHPYKRS